MSKPHIIIVGSGWAGFYLADYLSPTLYTITIISPRRTSAYTPLLASAACGLFNFYLAEEPIRSKSRKCRFLKATVTSISFPSKTVHCAPAFDNDTDPITNQNFDLQYDYLILAPGCVPNTFGTPGVIENALFMKNVSDAMATRKLLFDLLEKASLPTCPPDRKKELLHIAVVGGGPTGVEITAELDDLAHRELRDLYPDVAPYLHISIYDVAPHILGNYERKLHEYANERLVSRHVAVETNTRIEKVDRDALFVKGKGRVPYGMLMWVTGNKATALVTGMQEVRKSEKGLVRVLTDTHLRVLKSRDSDEVWDNVFALGDAADIEGNSLPTTAEVAVQKAKYLVNFFNSRSEMSLNVPASMPFMYAEKQLVSYIGSRDGIIAGRGDREGWTGRSAWLAWRSGSVMWTRSWRNRIVILLTWMLNWVFGKEIAKM
ncbi:MAG: hypothetical protein L6R38_006789 [Xanthoria sp. 2 TBL-2021]|nr:MAG: hypothetical protein L6R38_006789 [Xanthoria sp. 2 TBL-2021]